MGMSLGFLMKNNPEVHLLSALAAGLIALLSGFVPTPPSIRPLIVSIMSFNPLSGLAKILLNIGRGFPLEENATVFASATLAAATVGAFFIRMFDWQEIFHKLPEK